MLPEQARIDVLARRVRWLDRHRRRISGALAVVAAALLWWRLAVWLGNDWPRFHVYSLTITIAVAAWFVVEIAIAWMLALWETEHDRMVRSRGVPEARLLRK